MLKQIITGCCFVLLSTAAAAQTLFTYAHDTVSVAEFLQAYNKNNTGAKNAKAMREYLDLYIASRLKIKEAKARGYDTLPQIVSDLENLRAQIVPAYLKDEESVQKLVDEAFARQQKDLHIAHIFIASSIDGLADPTAAGRAQQAYQKLKEGEAFAAVAKQYTDDPSAKTNGGDLGFITLFTLPYELENLAYTTPVGKTSAVYQSKGGYHIFKNLGERKALGRMKAAQILLAYPPGADAAYKQKIKSLADSLYNRLQKGDDFEKLATKFSNDVVSAASNGLMPEFGIGQFDAAFEKVVFSLPKNGAISKPFETQYGYHIVKRMARVPVATSKKDEKALASLREKIEESDRMNTTQSTLVQKILKSGGYQKAAHTDAALWAYTESVLDGKKASVQHGLTPSSPLFTLGAQTLTTADWITYAQTYRYKADGSGLKPYPQVWDEFVQATALNYYQQHLEDYNAAFRYQINEFKDGNLFFEIMQRQVWNEAQNDTAALQAYYEKNKTKYRWNHSADAVIFYAGDMAAANNLKAQLAKAPAQWKELSAQMSDKVAVDSGRFEREQLPGALTQMKDGTLTQPLLNSADNTASFAYIIKAYHGPAQRSFAEAKGQVINDYQADLEKRWIEELKKKYPVTINEKALATLAR